MVMVRRTDNGLLWAWIVALGLNVFSLGLTVGRILAKRDARQESVGKSPAEAEESR